MPKCKAIRFVRRHLPFHVYLPHGLILTSEQVYHRTNLGWIHRMPGHIPTVPSFDISTSITFTTSVILVLKSTSGSASFTSFERNARLNAVHAVWSRWFVRTIRRTRIEPWTSILERVRLCRSLFLDVSIFCSLIYFHPCVGLHHRCRHLGLFGPYQFLCPTVCRTMDHWIDIVSRMKFSS